MCVCVCVCVYITALTLHYIPTMYSNVLVYFQIENNTVTLQTAWAMKVGDLCF